MSSALLNKKLAIEAKTMGLFGVCGVGLGQNSDGVEVIQILLSIPIQSFSVPDFLQDPDITLVYAGDIQAE